MTDSKRRYIPIIHRTYQYRFLTFTLAYTIIVVFFMAAFIFVPEFMTMTDPHVSFEAQSRAADKILYGHAKMWPFLIALLFLIGMHSLRVFARFVGPLYQFTQAFEKISEGDLNFRVEIRKGDYLHDERDGINDMIESVSSKIKDIQQAKDELLWTLDRMEKENSHSASGPPLKDRLSELRMRAGKLEASIQAFRLTPLEQGEAPQTERDALNEPL
ncbi:MAG: methyl-accepting chemotaxis protein [Desulfobacterales bacterium]|jgi:methyl-accepting chemotaxis protein